MRPFPTLTVAILLLAGTVTQAAIFDHSCTLDCDTSQSQVSFCASDYAACLADCSEELGLLVAGHCACDSGHLYYSYSYALWPGADYCCGSGDCRASVADFYALTEKNGVGAADFAALVASLDEPCTAAPARGTRSRPRWLFCSSSSSRGRRRRMMGRMRRRRTTTARACACTMI